MTSQNPLQNSCRAGIHSWLLNKRQINPRLGGYWSIKIPHSDVRKGLLFIRPLHKIWNELTNFPAKKFKYTTPVLTMQEYQSTALLSPKVYHYLATPEDMKTRISNILALRTQIGIQDRPLLIWEPAPLACKAETLQTCLEAAALVDVFSPNHIELARLFQDSPISPDKFEIERLALKILDSGVGPEGNGVVVIRAGENGCLVQSRGLARKWIPPFYEAGME